MNQQLLIAGKLFKVWESQLYFSFVEMLALPAAVQAFASLMGVP